jgi:hypothetical protein
MWGIPLFMNLERWYHVALLTERKTSVFGVFYPHWTP